MPNSKMFRPVVVGKKKRYTYARSQEVLKMPHLLDLQTKSYEWFCKEGLKDVFADISPIEDSAKKWALHFGDFYFGKGKYNIEQCKAKDVNYSAPLYVKTRLENKETGELKEHDLFMGDFPVMTRVHSSSMAPSVSSYPSWFVPLAYTTSAKEMLLTRRSIPRS